MEFDTVLEAKDFWKSYGGMMGFDVRQLYANKCKLDNSVSSFRLVCAKEGQRRPDKRDHLTKQPRAETRTSCQVRMSLKFARDIKKYVICDLELNHNHILQISETSHMMPSQRKISEVQALQIDLADEADIRPKETHELTNLQAGGKDVLGYTKQDQKNYLRSKRKRDLAYGEAGSLLKYFHRQLLDNPSFQYAIQLDNEEKITNIFWADARMVIDYAIFGDVITFDTTYCTNKENRPLGVFCGFNHHREIVIFGAALLYDESKESFIWLFESFLEAHMQKKPKTIFTDQDPAMASALVEKMPETYHGLCVWHIMQNAIRHLGNKLKDGSFILRDFKACIYNSEDQFQFQETWDALLQRYKVEDNSWLKSIYKVKEKWAHCYMKKVYTIGMRSTQLSESFNSDLKDFMRSNLDIIHFLKQFELAVGGKRYKELQAEYNARQKLPRLKMIHSPLLKHAAQVYTPNAFDLFQNEFDWSSAAYIISRIENNQMSEYQVAIFDKDGEYTVSGNVKDMIISCSCGMFETMGGIFEITGFLCCHCLKVLNVWDVKQIPAQYIMKRWTREAREMIVHDSDGKVVQSDTRADATARYKNICFKAIKLAARSSDFEVTSNFVEQVIEETYKKVDSFCRHNQNDNVSNILNAKEIVNSCSDGDALERLLENVKGLKKKEGRQGRKRLKSWVEKQSNKRMASTNGVKLQHQI
ncbi:protein FAR1-RELATED SEQUENCE 5-like [Arachis duranensis]|uniref:Protein FAR1-RELATED SEQUENCE 5-like n=1 Tax=Arachis duranensis TaxID=130453 RepID=A0A6P4B1V0_ARADU|nr:protein FAR1-RELATED SEQUENCE 5-like [Arachis duranensis]